MGSFNQRLYYALLMLLMCMAAAAFFMLIFSFDTRQKADAFAREGTVAQGVVLDKSWTYKFNTAYHNLHVRFVDLNGTERKKWVQTHPLVFERVRVGGPVAVTYLRSKPETFFLADDAPTAKGATGFAYGALASGVVAAILVVAVFRVRRRLREA